MGLQSGEGVAIDTHRDVGTFKKGDAVMVNMEPDRCLVYATPREGLTEVLKLE